MTSLIDTLLGRSSSALVGLDISSSAVKLLELSKRGSHFAVEAYAVEPLPPGAVNDKQLSDPAVVAEVIARAVSRAGTRTKEAAIAVAGSSVITKVISMPASLRELEMEDQIKSEADQYIPYPIDEVNLDFQVLGPTGRGGSDTVDVLLAACRKEQVDSRVAALELAGLKAVKVDIEAYALENACQFLRQQMPDQGAKKTVAVVDMGASTTSVLVLHDMVPVYTRDQAFGGRQLTEDIMRLFGMTQEEAGKAKRLGGLPERYTAEVMPRFIDDMAQQIDRSLQFFFSASAQHSQVDQIILAGGCAHIPEVDKLMQERLHIPTVVARPLAKLSVAPRARPQQLARDEASMLIACGLAVRAFDHEG